MCFSTYFGYLVRGIGGGGGGGSKWIGMVHNMLMQFFTLGSSKIKISEKYLFDILATHNAHSSYVKHVLGNVYLVFDPTWVFDRGGGGGRGGSPNGPVHNLLMQCFTLYGSKIKVSET